MGGRNALPMLAQKTTPSKRILIKRIIDHYVNLGISFGLWKKAHKIKIIKKMITKAHGKRSTHV